MCGRVAIARPLVSLLGLALLLGLGGQAARGEGAAALRGQCKPAQFRLVIDVGHTAGRPGAKSARGLGEYDFNLRLGGEIEQALKAAGFTRTLLLIVSRPPPVGLMERVVRANSLPADLLLSIHHDSVPDRLLERWIHAGEQRGFSDRFKGHSIFVSIDNGDFAGSLGFARLLGRQLKSRGLAYTPHYTEKIMADRRRLLVDKDAGVYRYDQLIVLRSTHMPAVLLEAGSIINRDEELVLSTPEHRALISAGAVDAVKAFCAARAGAAAARL